MTHDDRTTATAHRYKSGGIRWLLCIGAGAASLGVGQAARAELPSSFAPDAFYVQAGGAQGTQTLAVGLSWDWNTRWTLGPGELRPYIEVMLSQWRYDASTPVGKDHLTQLAMTPSLRWRGAGGASPWFFEAGVGLSFTSSIYHSTDKQFSTSFNFGSHLGVGRNFGARQEHELAVRVEHFSNAGIKHPNPGQNFVQLRYAYRFE
ncbi:acyloxyacyl hydrolase [Variovorax sp. OV329]|uniref:acyloxyacyl hydrolase n=1 Tax=Variovorax sp. OV329 TaxID=1882825 RepID=UPI0008EC530D|nr:acyloxyacyl hydrolase [Variovorax sp. OV329]SFM62356.1 Lipid A 3-O-deacylase (PagL) [Variovorax sp. OV329]